MRSVDASGKEEVLDDRHNLDLAEVKEELVKLFLVSAVQNQVSPEDKYAGCKYRQNFQSFEAYNSVQQHVHLVHLKTTYKAVVDPLEGCAKGLNTKLVHVEADLWLVHLKQVFE